MKNSIITLIPLILILINQLKAQSSISLLNIKIELTKLADTQQTEIKLNGPLGILLNDIKYIIID